VQGKEGSRRFDEVHGNGWRLVLLGSDAACIGENERSWFESIGGRVLALDDPDPLFIRWFTEHDTTCALRRPDFYLYGTAPSEKEATTLLADLRSHLERGKVS
jgi:3-(3-hydroxy-phenyl)propionate hydroxylase